jgi:hypothetical protein
MLGERIGSYEVLEEIGEGGVATCDRARQASVARDGSIKVIRRALAGDPEDVPRFQHGARLTDRMEHRREGARDPGVREVTSSGRPP